MLFRVLAASYAANHPCGRSSLNQHPDSTPDIVYWNPPSSTIMGGFPTAIASSGQKPKRLVVGMADHGGGATDHDQRGPLV